MDSLPGAEPVGDPASHGEASDSASSPARQLLRELGRQRGRRGAIRGRPPPAPLQEEVGRALRHLLSRQQAEEHCGRAADEWRQVALLADHTLFWVFLVITTVSSLMFLVVLPVYKRSQYQRPD